MTVLMVSGAAMLAGRAPYYSPAGLQHTNETTAQEREMQDRMQREGNKKRQQQIKDDTQKLYQLAGELKDAVDKSNENLLSLEVVRKAEEVEKLAHRVKEKMREGTGKPANTDQKIELPKPGV